MCLGSSLRPSPGGTCPEHLSREVSRRRPKQTSVPSELAFLIAEKSRLYSTDRAPPHSAACVCSLVLAVTAQNWWPGVRGKDVDQLLNRELCLSA